MWFAVDYSKHGCIFTEKPVRDDKHNPGPILKIWISKDPTSCLPSFIHVNEQDFPTPLTWDDEPIEVKFVPKKREK